jgi:PAS domain S-box-containing protein
MKNEQDALRENRNKNSLDQKSNNSQISTNVHDLNLSNEQHPNDNLKIIKDSFEKDINIDIGEIQENYLKIFENFYIGITIADNNERIIYWNKYAEELLKMDEKELFLKDVCSLYPQEEWNKIRGENVRQKGIKNKIETKMIKKNGEIFDCELSLCVLKGAEGKISGSIGLINDLSSLKTTERRLIESEEKYKSIFENSAVAIMLTDENEKIISWNEYTEKMLGFNKDDLYHKNVSNLYSPEEWQKIRSENIRQKGMQHHLETKIITKNNQLLDVDISISVLKDYRGSIVGSIGIIKDISEQKKIEEELIKSKNKFRGIFDATSDFLLYIEKEIMLDINQTALDLIGLDKKDIIGKSFLDLKMIFSEENIKTHLDAIRQANNGKKITDYESDLISKNEDIYRFLFAIDSIKEGNEIKGLLIRGKDITQRQRAWQELLKLEKKYRVLAETSADGVITIDPLGRLTYVNPSFERMCARRKSQILATLFRDYLSDDSVYFFQQVCIDARKKDEKIENIELELVHSDGNLIPIEVNISPLKKENEFVGMVCTIRDITERRRVEDELKKSERLKTEFMNIAAHELKSPVTPIKGYLDLIISDKDTSEQIKNWARVSLRNAERLLGLVNDILDVSRLDTDTMRFDMEKLNPIEILNEIAEDMKPIIEGKNIKFITNIPNDLPNIMGDKHRLSQVLKNLLVNAIKFTDNGSITLGAEKKDQFIEIYVKDTGIGISKGELKKIFNKFYQAYTGDDRKNEGTGLGLFICKQILQKHNGDIWVESDLGRGSAFHIKVPYLHKMVVNLNK